MAWLELDPDPANDAIAAAHLEPGYEAMLRVNWEIEQELTQKMAEAGIRSDDEFVGRATKQRNIAPAVGCVSVQDTIS